MRKLVLMSLLVIGTASFVLGQNNGNGNGNNGNGNNGKGNNGKGNNGKGNNGNGSRGVAPEIDPNSAASAVALLSGGALVIRGRRKK